MQCNELGDKYLAEQRKAHFELSRAINCPHLGSLPMRQQFIGHECSEMSFSEGEKVKLINFSMLLVISLLISNRNKVN